MSLTPIPQKQTPGARQEHSYLKSLSNLYSSLAPVGFVPPQAVEFEQSLLGAALYHAPSASRIVEIIGERTLEDTPFYRDAHSLIYFAITALARKNEPVDLLTVTDQLRKDGELDNIGGAAYLLELTTQCVTTVNVESHVRIMLEKHVARELIRFCEETKLRAFEGEFEISELKNELESKLMRLDGAFKRRTTSHVKSGIQTAFKALNDASKRGGIIGIPTHIKSVDDLTLGIENGVLSILAGGTSEGKSAFMLQTILNNIRQGIACAYITPEMTREQVLHRLWANMAEIELRDLRSGLLSDDEQKRLRNAMYETQSLPLFVNDQSGITSTEIRSALQRLVRDEGVKYVAIDFLQIVSPGQPQPTRERDIATVMQDTYNCMKDLDLSGVMGCQLNRDADVEKHPPRKRDLKESSAIEQLAANIYFLWANPKDQDDDNISNRAIITFIGAKGRNSGKGEVKLLFDKRYQRFEEAPPIFPTLAVEALRSRYEKEPTQEEAF